MVCRSNGAVLPHECNKGQIKDNWSNVGESRPWWFGSSQMLKCVSLDLSTDDQIIGDDRSHCRLKGFGFRKLHETTHSQWKINIDTYIKKNAQPADTNRWHPLFSASLQPCYDRWRQDSFYCIYRCVDGPLYNKSVPSSMDCINLRRPVQVLGSFSNLCWLWMNYDRNLTFGRCCSGRTRSHLVLLFWRRKTLKRRDDIACRCIEFLR